MRFFFSLFITVLALTGCSKQSYDLNLTSSTAFLELTEALAREFQRETGLQVSVKGTLGQEEQLLKQNLTDLVITDHELNQSLYSSRLIGRQEVIVIANTANSLSTLSEGDLAKVFSGQLGNWSGLGGSAMNIQILSREPGSGIRQTFEQYYLGGDDLSVSLKALTVNSNAEMQSAIANLQGGIGYISIGQLQNTVKEIKILNKSGEPLDTPRRLVYLCSKKKENKAIQEFYKFLENSPIVQTIYAGRGVVTQ